MSLNLKKKFQIQSLFDTEKASRTTESPIETLNKLRQKVVVKTTLKPLSQYPDSKFKGNSNSQNKPREEPQPRTESPLDCVIRLESSSSPNWNEIYFHSIFFSTRYQLN